MRTNLAERLAAGIVLAMAMGLVAPTAAPAAAPQQSQRSSARTTAAAPDPRDVGVRFSRVASGLAQPVAIAAPRDGSRRIFVVERRGTIRYYRDGRLSGLYLDIRGRVNDSGGEQGLLGLAFHPNFKSNRYFYVSYTATNGELRVTRFRVSTPGSSKVDTDTARRIIMIPHPGPTNHNGGQLAFNRDGMLYISTGDGGDGGDQAQLRSRLLGKILRIDVNRSCGGRRYCSPTSNPYYGHNTYRHELWAYGLRNPWKFSFDRAYGTLFIGDVGQSSREEIDKIPYGRGGWNLGWNCYEGTVRYGGNCLSGVTYRFPIHEYGRSQGGTVIGGYVYRASRYPMLRGIYIYGDFISGRVWGFRGGVNAQLGTFPGGQYSLTSFGETQYGHLHAVSYDGRLFRVVGYTR